jgi:hypothetical protein
MAKAAKGSISNTAIRTLREYGLQYPGAHIKSPWPGHEDLAVKDKTFAYLPPEGEPFSIGCKLPNSSGVALMLPWCQPTPYGLGKSGWVTAQPSEDQIDVDMFKAWIDESYRAQAPKKLIAEIAISPDGSATDDDDDDDDDNGTAKPAAKNNAAKKPAAKKPAAKKPTAKKPAAKSKR